MQAFTEIPYTPALDRVIRNMAALPAGTGAKYLLCLYVTATELVAKQWCRKRPTLKPGQALVVFK